MRANSLFVCNIIQRFGRSGHSIQLTLPPVPWLFIYGTKDRSCTAFHREIMRRHAPQVKVVALEGVAHWVMVEASENVLRCINDFVLDVECEVERCKL